MRSIARALNTIALAINNLAKALNPPKEQVITFPVSTTYTSNPYNAISKNAAKNVKITSVYQGKNYYEDKVNNVTTSYGQWSVDGNQSPKIAHIHKDEKVALDAVYDALTDKGNHPDHHDHIMRELSTKWPVLYKALKQLVVARKESYNLPSSEIWKKNNIW
jgi:hypothetical protein